jgi:CspA family cold shock protein
MSRRRGVITTWIDAKAYGFITPELGREDVFAHASALEDWDPRVLPRPGETCTFELEVSAKGPRARAVRLEGDGESA